MTDYTNDCGSLGCRADKKELRADVARLRAALKCILDRADDTIVAAIADDALHQRELHGSRSTSAKTGDDK